MKKFLSVNDLGNLKEALNQAFEIKKNRYFWIDLVQNKKRLIDLCKFCLKCFLAWLSTPYQILDFQGEFAPFLSFQVVWQGWLTWALPERGKQIKASSV